MISPLPWKWLTICSRRSCAYPTSLSYRVHLRSNRWLSLVEFSHQPRRSRASRTSLKGPDRMKIFCSSPRLRRFASA